MPSKRERQAKAKAKTQAAKGGKTSNSSSKTGTSSDKTGKNGLSFLDNSKLISYNGKELTFQMGLTFGSEELFAVSQVALQHGQIYALTAPNGAGKSSFADMLSKIEGFPKHLSVGILRCDGKELVKRGERDRNKVEIEEVEGEKSETQEESGASGSGNSDGGKVAGSSSSSTGAGENSEAGTAKKVLSEEEETNNLKPLQFLLRSLHKRKAQIKSQISQLESEIENYQNDPDADDSGPPEALITRLNALYELQDSESGSSSGGGGFSSDEAIEKTALNALERLKFKSANYIDTKVGDLSGGWKYKLKLAEAILSKPELLIIDEPSFLDAESSDWFMRYLREECAGQRPEYGSETNSKSSASLSKSAKKAAGREAGSGNCIVILISHKERLLEETCSKILYISAGSQASAENSLLKTLALGEDDDGYGGGGGDEEDLSARHLLLFHGPYSSFLKARDEEETAAENLAALIEHDLQHAQKQEDHLATMRAQNEATFANQNSNEGGSGSGNQGKNKSLKGKFTQREGAARQIHIQGAGSKYKMLQKQREGMREELAKRAKFTKWSGLGGMTISGQAVSDNEMLPIVRMDGVGFDWGRWKRAKAEEDKEKAKGVEGVSASSPTFKPEARASTNSVGSGGGFSMQNTGGGGGFSCANANPTEVANKNSGSDTAPPLLQNLHLQICPRDRIALTGKNGAGKSTLLKLITGAPITRTRTAKDSITGETITETVSESLKSNVGSNYTVSAKTGKVSEGEIKQVRYPFGELKTVYFPQNAAMELLSEEKFGGVSCVDYLNKRVLEEKERMEKERRENEAANSPADGGQTAGSATTDSHGNNTVASGTNPEEIPEKETKVPKTASSSKSKSTSSGPTVSPTKARAHFSQFGLTTDVVKRPVTALSTGQRTRLYLAVEMYVATFVSGNIDGLENDKAKVAPPNLLVLDEISDNLDFDTVECLCECLREFDGAILAVSHEVEDFLAEFCEVEWRLEGGRVKTKVGL